MEVKDAHKVVNAMKHVLHFSVDEDGMREFAVETDDLRDVAGWSWFRDFLSLKGGYREDYPPMREPVRETVREDPRISELRSMLEQYAEENKRLVKQTNQMQAFIDAAIGPSGMPQPSMPPQQMAPPSPPQQAPPMAPPPRGPPGQVDPFSLNPNQMTEAVWNTMSPQIQDQWMKKWGIGQ